MPTAAHNRAGPKGSCRLLPIIQWEREDQRAHWKTCVIITKGLSASNALHPSAIPQDQTGCWLAVITELSSSLVTSPFSTLHSSSLALFFSLLSFRPLFPLLFLSPPQQGLISLGVILEAIAARTVTRSWHRWRTNRGDNCFCLEFVCRPISPSFQNYQQHWILLWSS